MISDQQIERLQAEAGEYGDRALVVLCARALEGDEEAREECEAVIREALAQHDEVRP